MGFRNCVVILFSFNSVSIDWMLGESYTIIMLIGECRLTTTTNDKYYQKKVVNKLCRRIKNSVIFIYLFPI